MKVKVRIVIYPQEGEMVVNGHFRGIKKDSHEKKYVNTWWKGLTKYLGKPTQYCQQWERFFKDLKIKEKYLLIIKTKTHTKEKSSIGIGLRQENFVPGVEGVTYLRYSKKKTETQDSNFRQTDPQILRQWPQEKLLELLGKLFPWAPPRRKLLENEFLKQL